MALRRVTGATMVCAATGLVAAAPAPASSTVTYSAGGSTSSVDIQGETNDDVMSVVISSDTIVVTDNGTGGITTADPDCTAVTPSEVSCPVNPPDPPPPAEPTQPVGFLGADLGPANDSFSITGGSFFTDINGDAGDDTIQGGPTVDGIDGGQGNDTVLGGDGSDFLDGGGAGASTGGTDFIDGQGGFDQVSFPRTLAVNVSLNGQPDDGFPGEGDNVAAERVSAGAGDDVLTGDAQANALAGGDGNDLITGLEGNDVLTGSDGDDGLIGGPQRDRLECGDEFDIGVRDPSDEVEPDCERTGAEVGDGTAVVNGKRRAKVPVSCPVEEASTCAGSLILMAGGRQIGAGTFSLGAGATGRVGVRLTKQGAKTLTKTGAGTLLVDVQAHTTEPIGTSIQQADLLLTAKRPGKRGR